MMFAEYTIRRAEPSDASQIAIAHRDSIQSIGPRFYPSTVVDEWGEGLTPDLYVKAMEAGEVFYVARAQVDDRPIVLGFATYRIDDARDGGSVYVRGAATRHGIGSALLRTVEEHAMAQGAATMPVESSLAGIDFYKANGFEETGRGHTLLLSGRSMACVFMRKTLVNR